MGLTITGSQFESATKDNRLHFRSSELRQVITLLKALPDHPDVASRLAEAVRRWYRVDPKEFRRRDEISGGLCTQLLNELGLSRIDSIEPKDAAFEFVVTDRFPDRRPHATPRFLDASIEDYLMHTLMYQAAHTAIVLIDMQNTAAANEQHGENTVGEHQAAVLEI